MDRTVTTPTEGTNRGDMNVVGYIIAGGVFIVLLPVLPLLLVLELIDRLSGTEEERRGSDELEPAPGEG